MQNTSAVDGMHVVMTLDVDVDVSVVMTLVTTITTDLIKLTLHFVVELGLASLHVACYSM